MTLEVPSELYKTLQDVMMQEAKRLCKDAAKLLKVSEKELQTRILKDMPSLSLKIIDDKDQPIECPVFVKNATILERCRHGCLLGTGRCLSHQGIHSLPELEEQTTLTRLQPAEDVHISLWCNEETKDVFSADGKEIGFYEDETLYLYTLDTSEA